MAVNISRIDPTPLRISTNVTIARQTPKTDFGDRMKAGIAAAMGATGSAAVGAPVSALNGSMDVFQGFHTGLEEMERNLRRRPDASQLQVREIVDEVTRLKMLFEAAIRRFALRARGS